MNYIHNMIDDLDLQQLRMFFVLARTRSFTRTGQQLFRTQSAVSHAIRKLEQTIGATLFHRTRRALFLTDEGECLFSACERLFGAIESAVEEIAARKGTSVGKLRVGATVEFGCTILMRHMRAFMESHPEIEMSFELHHELISRLMEDRLDIIIDCKEHALPSLKKTPLFREKYVVVCSKEYFSEYKPTTLDQLENCTILSMDQALTWWNNFCLTIPEDRRPTFRRLVPINHVRGIITAAREGIGVAFVPRYCVLNEIQNGELKVLFPDLELLEDRFVLYQKESRSGLLRNRLFTRYLLQIHPSEFGA